jgi:hypothetical protein
MDLGIYKWVWARFIAGCNLCFSFMLGAGNHTLIQHSAALSCMPLLDALVGCLSCMPLLDALVGCVSWMPLYLSFIKNPLLHTVYIST